MQTGSGLKGPRDNRKALARFAFKGLVAVAFLHLTAPSGKMVLIRPDQIQVVRSSGPENPPGSHAVIVSANGFQAVRETVAEIDGMLSALRSED